ncbi:hypothetical protein NC653_020246 [Populus alba x Populus x berolinensis]|uniref:Uncharacterized protein n=1 Tax=Populus alba x Populus x berolinensis TaxID=444605 RepID=A0AAD6MKF3_9ROSI|nr:hypothetical protein NC653_020246 [Populus alba x Populus x berolinensis]
MRGSPYSFSRAWCNGMLLLSSSLLHLCLPSLRDSVGASLA